MTNATLGRGRWLIGTGALAALLTAASADDPAPPRPTAMDGFAKIQAAVTANDPELLDVLMPAKLVEGRRDPDKDAVAKWRAALGKSLAAAKALEAHEDGDDAQVRLSAGGGEALVLLHFGGTRWIVSSALSYPLAASAAAAKLGRGDRTHLGIRTTNDDYGDTAFSFRYVTSDAEACKNRMNVWFCHNGDLHATRGSTVADAGESATTEMRWLPSASAFGTKAHATAGHSYVVHVLDERYATDFYVELAVIRADDTGLDFTWQVLASGLGAPASTKKAVPLARDDRDGADGCDGLCGKDGGSGGSGTGGSGSKGGKGGKGGK
jgi:hypothetical protein